MLLSVSPLLLSVDVLPAKSYNVEHASDAEAFAPVNLSVQAAAIPLL